VTRPCAGWPGFDSWQGQGFFSSPLSIPALGSTKPPIQWVPGVKWQGYETDHSPPSGAKVKNVWSYTSTSHTSSWYGMQLSMMATLPLLTINKRHIHLNFWDKNRLKWHFPLLCKAYYTWCFPVISYLHFIGWNIIKLVWEVQGSEFSISDEVFIYISTWTPCIYTLFCIEWYLKEGYFCGPVQAQCL
jgi:hypothetical protein